MARNRTHKSKTARVQAFRDRVTEAGGKRVEFYLTPSAAKALARWKALTGATTNTTAINMAISAAVKKTEAV